MLQTTYYFQACVHLAHCASLPPQKQYTISVVKKKIADGVKEEKGDVDMDPPQLSEIPGGCAPELEGQLLKESTVLKRWKKHYAAITPNYEISLMPEKGKPETGVINLWGYKCVQINDKPKGKRRGGPQWVGDKERNECKKCNAAFTVTVRRHHCRACGEIFCGKCTAKRVNLNHFGYEEPERVCPDCYDSHSARSRTQSIAVSAPPQLQTPTEDGAAEKKEAFYGISLVHATRLPYILSFPTADDRDKWFSALSICAKFASAPRNPNPVMADAFEAAHQTACTSSGMEGAWRITGTESEMLGELITYNLREKVLKEELAKISVAVPAALQERAIEAIETQVRKLVTAAVQPGWKKICAKIEEKSKDIEAKLAPVLGPVGNARQQLKNKIHDGILSTVQPAIDKVVGPVLDKVMGAALELVISIFQQTLVSFNAEVLDVADAVNAAGDKKDALDSAVSKAMKNVGEETPVMKKVYEAATTLGTELRALRKEHEQLKDLEVSPFVDGILANCHVLLRNAVYTLQSDETLQSALKMAGVNGRGVVMEAYKRTGQKLAHDAGLSFVAAVQDLLAGMAVQKALAAVADNAAVSAICDPLEELIPEIAKDFVSIVDTRDEIVEETVGDVIKTAVAKGSKSAKQKLAEALP